MGIAPAGCLDVVIRLFALWTHFARQVGDYCVNDVPLCGCDALMCIHPPPNQCRAGRFRHTAKLCPFFKRAPRHADLVGHLLLGNPANLGQGSGIPNQSALGLVRLHGCEAFFIRGRVGRCMPRTRRLFFEGGETLL